MRFIEDVNSDSGARNILTAESEKDLIDAAASIRAHFQNAHVVRTPLVFS